MAWRGVEWRRSGNFQMSIIIRNSRGRGDRAARTGRNMAGTVNGGMSRGVLREARPGMAGAREPGGAEMAPPPRSRPLAAARRCVFARLLILGTRGRLSSRQYACSPSAKTLGGGGGGDFLERGYGAKVAER